MKHIAKQELFLSSFSVALSVTLSTVFLIGGGIHQGIEFTLIRDLDLYKPSLGVWLAVYLQMI